LKLSGVEQSKFDTGRCTIIFENGEKLKSFTSVAADMGLYAGKELSDEEVLKLRNASRTMSAKARAARIVGAANVSKEQLVKRSPGIYCGYNAEIVEIYRKNFAGMVARVEEESARLQRR